MSCTSSANCWAVGNYTRGIKTLALHWNGASWTHVASPNPSSKFEDSLETVACPSAKSCWALGHYYAAPLKPTVTGYLIALHWNGSQWSRATAPSSKGSLADVSCTSSANCWAVGNLDSNNTNLNLAEHWNGSAWSSL